MSYLTCHVDVCHTTLVSCVAWLGNSLWLPTFVTSLFWKGLKYRPTLLFCTWRPRKGQPCHLNFFKQRPYTRNTFPILTNIFNPKRLTSEKMLKWVKYIVDFVGQDFSSQSNWWAGTTVKGNCSLCILMHTICQVFARQKQYGTIHSKPAHNVESGTLVTLSREVTGLREGVSV